MGSKMSNERKDNDPITWRDISELAQRITALEGRTNVIESRLDVMNEMIERLDRKVADLTSMISQIRDEVRNYLQPLKWAAPIITALLINLLLEFLKRVFA